MTSRKTLSDDEIVQEIMQSSQDSCELDNETEPAHTGTDATITEGILKQILINEP